MQTFSNGFSLILYILVYSLSAKALTLNIVDKNTNREKCIWNIVLAIILPTFVFAIRYKVGADYLNYVGMYKELKDITFTKWFEDLDFFNNNPTGMFLIAKIARKFNSVNIFFGITAFLTAYLAVISLKKQWSNMPIGYAYFIYLIFTFSTGLNIIKQTIAISIVFYSLKYVYEKKKLYFILLVFIAFLFHSTAFVVLPIYILWDKEGKVALGKKIVIVAACFIGFSLMDNILNAMGDHWAEYTETTGTKNLSFFISLAWLIIFYIFRNRLVKLDKRNDLLIMIYTIGVIFSVMGFWSIFGKRVANYFTVVQCLLMPQIPCTLEDKMDKIAMIALMIYVVGLFTYQCMIMGQTVIFPYSYKMW